MEQLSLSKCAKIEARVAGGEEVLGMDDDAKTPHPGGRRAFQF